MTLKSEITVDPLRRGYSTMTDQQIVDSLNAVNRTRNRTSITGDELFSATDEVEYIALSSSDRLLWVSFCGRDSIDPFGKANVAFVKDLFGNGSATVLAMAGDRVESVSRADELGVRVGIGLAQEARR